ncbi:MAG: hypothetical protein CSA45_00405 [Gammaproteobacteria bacterium]|nr:MAG: hypothetical protein CSA45_00405 [Gammaproteobacteria bacterium]
MKKNRFIAIALIFLAGCASDELQRQVNHLTTTVNRLESNVSNLQRELGEIKRKGVVRLPTGSPTHIEARVSPEESDFNQALQRYKSGDIAGGMDAFERFNSQYPNARRHAEALYYLGQGNYTMRNYARAQQVLEELVYQTPNRQPSQQALQLLASVYRAQGNTAKLQALQSYLKTP